MDGYNVIMFIDEKEENNHSITNRRRLLRMAKFKKLKISRMFQIVLLFISVMTATAFSQYRVVLDESGTHGYSSTSLTVFLDRYSLDTVLIKGKKYLKINLPEAGIFAGKGQPDLPDAVKPVIIPDDMAMQANVTDSVYVDIAVDGIIPNRGRISRNENPDTIPYAFGKEYCADAWFPENIVSLSKPFIYRDLRGTIVRICPFRYNPVEKILRVFSRISVSISTAATDSVNVLHRKCPLSSGIDREYDRHYANTFLNYSRTHYTVLDEDGSMLIIAPSAFMTTLAPFIEWKRRKGLVVDTISMETVGTTAGDLAGWISSYYTSSMTSGTARKRLKYVLLAGDVSEIPTPVMDTSEVYSTDETKNGADIKYGEIEGDDCYSELLIGRFSGSTAAEIKTQVDRSIYYETGMKKTDTWLSRALLTAYDDAKSTNIWNETDADFINHEYDTLIAAGYTSATALRYNRSAYCGSGSGCLKATDDAIVAEIDTGVAFWNYSDHGSKYSYSAVAEGFDTADAARLSNSGKYFYTYAVACNVGEFATGKNNCLAESFMKSQYNGRPAGCVGCYLSSIEQDWDPPYAAVREILAISLQRESGYNRYTLGGVMINGGMKAYEVRSDDICRGIVDSYVLFGDPNLQIYTSTPQAMTISHIDTCSTGEQIITVSGSVDGASVCIYCGKRNIQATGVISGGSAALTVTPVSTGDTLCVTAMHFNHETYQGIIRVTSGDMLKYGYTVKSVKLVFTDNGISYEIPSGIARDGVHVSIKLFSVNGSLVYTSVDCIQNPGKYSVRFDNVNNRQIASGVYICAVKIGDLSKNIKIMLR
jgi:gingipain R